MRRRVAGVVDQDVSRVPRDCTSEEVGVGGAATAYLVQVMNRLETAASSGRESVAYLVKS